MGRSEVRERRDKKMKEWLLDYLRCPNCLANVKSSGFATSNNGVVESGVLVCCNESCRAWYPIICGIPRMLPESLREESTSRFVQEYYDELKSLGLLEGGKQIGKDALLALKQHTIQNFGFEWIEYARFGWDDPVYNIQSEEAIFWRKSLLEPQELKGKVVLDAGCGNGRYSYWAAQHSGRVIGIDLGDGVESASQNTAHLPNVQIVQADIFNPPFEDGCFDFIFSIGVLMHTGNAKKATVSLARKLKADGSLTIHLYGKGNLFYEFIDRSLRNRTTKLSISDLQAFTQKAYRLRRLLERLKVARYVTRFVRLDSHPHCIFDWYSAPIATHHTYPEVKDWYDELGLQVVKAKGRVQSASVLRRGLDLFLGGSPTVTVRGIR